MYAIKFILILLFLVHIQSFGMMSRVSRHSRVSSSKRHYRQRRSQAERDRIKYCIYANKLFSKECPILSGYSYIPKNTTTMKDLLAFHGKHCYTLKYYIGIVTIFIYLFFSYIIIRMCLMKGH